MKKQLLVVSLIFITYPLLAQLSVDFTFTPDNTCSGTNISFTSTVTGGNPAKYVYNWSFSDGYSHIANPKHIFNVFGCGTQNYAVTLIVHDTSHNNPLGDTVQKVVQVKRRPEPQLHENLSSPEFKNCYNDPPPSPANPNFTISVNDITPNNFCITSGSYTIDWGDGSPLATGLVIGFINLQHTYTQLGAFNLVFSALGDNGCMGTTTYIVGNEAYPQGAIDLNGSYSPTCAPETYQFIISGHTDNSPSTTYDFDFGDGSSMVYWTHDSVILYNNLIEHTYINSSCPNPSHYFSVVMSIANTCGNGSSTRTTSIIWSKSIARVDTSGLKGCIGQPINYNNLSYSGFGPGCASNDTYFWDLGNGLTYTGYSPPSQTFNTSGTFDGFLIANNFCGKDTAFFKIEIDPEPVAKATQNTNQGCIPFEVNFTNQSSGGELTFKWTIIPDTGFVFIHSDSTSINPVIRFTSKGIYKVSLKAENNCSDSTIFINIIAKDKPNITYSHSLGPNCTPYNYMPTAIFDSAFGTIDTYSWQFEGGVPSSSSNKIPGNIIYNNPGTFGITITAHNECGIFTLADSIEIINRPVITEFPQNISVCLSQAPVYFRARVNHQLANTGWSCDLSTPCTITDDGYFTPNQAGLFKINFMYGNIQNCTVDSSFYVTVIALPSVNAGLDTGNCIQNTNFHIEGNCQTNQHWWSCNSSDIIFNDTVNGDFTTTVPGNYLFTLHCKDTINYPFCDSQDQLIFQVDPLPVLVHQPDTFCVSINKSFDLLNIYFTNKCYWNFGDGHTDTTYSPNIIANHTYTSTGIYTVIINAFSRYGCNNSDTFNIVVIDAPLQPQFNFSNFNPANHCGDTLEVSIHFDHKMYDNSIEFSWLCQNNTFIPYSKSCFTDTTLYFVQSNYTDTIYTITVNLRNRCGILSYSDNFVIHPLPKAKFKQGYTRLCSPRCIEFSNKSIGLPDYYTWNWGDTTMPVTTNDSIVKHCFYYYGNRDTTYYVKLTALNDCGKDSIIDSILVLPNRTKAILNVDNASGCPPLTVHFNSEASFGAYFYLWKFGDGNNSSTLQNPEFIYTHSGQYNAYLWIASKDTCSVDSTQININVYDVPEFNFTINQDSICKKERLEIENYSNNLYGYTWDFGDNTYSTDFNPTHLYDTTGLFYIKLKGESLLHCSDSLIKKIYVKDSPTAFINPINDDCAPYIVSLIPDTTSLYYLWDFGDGSPHSANPFHVYNKPGVYIITLVSEASSNCTDTAYRQIRVLPTPKSSFMFDFQSAQTDVTKLPAYLQTYNQSGEATDYVWYLDNDSISTEINPQVEITTLGSHIITLRSFNEYGCSDDTLISYDLFFYKLYLPNALWFSSDIPEDRVFTPKGIGLTKYHIKIYDKWDNLMWESDKIENFEPAESWDGTFKNQRVMEGTYYWIITELEFVNGAPKPNNSYKNTGIINVIY